MRRTATKVATSALLPRGAPCMSSCIPTLRADADDVNVLRTAPRGHFERRQHDNPAQATGVSRPARYSDRVSSPENAQCKRSHGGFGSEAEAKRMTVAMVQPPRQPQQFLGRLEGNNRPAQKHCMRSGAKQFQHSVASHPQEQHDIDTWPSDRGEGSAPCPPGGHPSAHKESEEQATEQETHGDRGAVRRNRHGIPVDPHPPSSSSSFGSGRAGCEVAVTTHGKSASSRPRLLSGISSSTCNPRHNHR